MKASTVGFMAAVCGVVAAAGMIAGAGDRTGAQPRVERAEEASELSSSLWVTESGAFVQSVVGEPGEEGEGRAVLGIRVRRSHERGSTRSWLQVGLIPGVVAREVEGGAEREFRVNERMLEGSLLVGGLSAAQAEALAEEIEAFVVVELPESPELIRTRTVMRRWTTSAPNSIPFSLSLTSGDGRYVLGYQSRDDQVGKEVGVDPGALAAALRAGAAELRLLEVAPPLFEGDGSVSRAGG